jgi:hypothetical protein
MHTLLLSLGAFATIHVLHLFSMNIRNIGVVVDYMRNYKDSVYFGEMGGNRYYVIRTPRRILVVDMNPNGVSTVAEFSDDNYFVMAPTDDPHTHLKYFMRHSRLLSWPISVLTVLITMSTLHLKRASMEQVPVVEGSLHTYRTFNAALETLCQYEERIVKIDSIILTV